MDPVPETLSASTPEVASRVESFLASRSARDAPEIEEFLDSLSGEARQRCLFELLVVELDGLNSDGKPLRQQDYLSRFPGDREIIENAFLRCKVPPSDLEPATQSFAAPQESTAATARRRENSGPSQSDAGAYERDKIGQYQILNTIAVHGQGAVYRANHPHLNRQVVIKVSKDQVDPVHRENLLAEGRTLAGLSHPNLAQIYDLQFEHGRPYLVMEYIEGRNLAEQLKDQPLEPQAAVKLIATIARAIHHAHSLGVIHCDLKPANVVIRASDNVPKVIDFGLARATMAFIEKDGISSYGGTIGYMAPEQAQEFHSMASSGRFTSDERVDVFALGAMLYELLAGKRLYNFNDGHEGLRLAADCNFDRSVLENVPAALGRVCLKALAKKPVDRWRSADEFAAALDATVREVEVPQEAGSSVQLRNILLTVVAVVAVVLILLSSLWQDLLTSESGLTREPNDVNVPDENELVPGLARSATVAVETPFSSDQFQHYSNHAQLGKNRESLFEVGFVREDDDFRLDAKFSTSGYFYLFAINPDGGVQLCYPEGLGNAAWLSTQTEPLRELHYPQDESSGFPFTDGVGQQALVFVHSVTPLPPFGKWFTSLGDIQGALDGTDKSWVWHDDSLSSLVRDRTRNSRGGPRELSGVGGFDELMARVQASLPEAQVSGITFPVVPKP